VLTHIIVLFFREFVCLHGFLRSITSNRVNKSIGHFWRRLWKNLNMKLQLCSTCHPHTNGKTKVVNRGFGNILICLVRQNKGSGIGFLHK
jgi:ribosomal protein L31